LSASAFFDKELLTIGFLPIDAYNDSPVSAPFEPSRRPTDCASVCRGAVAAHRANCCDDMLSRLNKDVFAHTATRGALKLTFVSETVAFFICDHWIT
jgi:hypothetical protein